MFLLATGNHYSITCVCESMGRSASVCFMTEFLRDSSPQNNIFEELLLDTLNPNDFLCKYISECPVDYIYIFNLFLLFS